MSAAAKRVKAAKAPADRASGTHRTSGLRTAARVRRLLDDVGVEVSAVAAATMANSPALKRQVELALGATGGSSISAAAIVSMARELHGATWLITSMSDMLQKDGRLNHAELDELAETIAQIAHRAENVAELERQLGAVEGGAL